MNRLLSWQLFALVAGTILIPMSMLGLLAGMLWGSLNITEQHDAVAAFPTMSTIYSAGADHWLALLIVGAVGGALFAAALLSIWSPLVLHVRTTTGVATIRVAHSRITIIE